MCYMDQSLTVIFIPACFRLSLSLRRGAPPLPATPLSTPPPIRRTAHPISHLLCWFFAARETFPNTNRAYGVYRLFTRHNARLSPLFRCITGFNYTKQGPERSHHGHGWVVLICVIRDFCTAGHSQPLILYLCVWDQSCVWQSSFASIHKTKRW